MVPRRALVLKLKIPHNYALMGRKQGAASFPLGQWPERGSRGWGMQHDEHLRRALQLKFGRVVEVGVGSVSIPKVMS